MGYFRKLILMVLVSIVFSIKPGISYAALALVIDLSTDKSSYGLIGDGVADDTASFQRVLDECSNKGLSVIFDESIYLLTHPVFIWGGCKVNGNKLGTLLYRGEGHKYLLNIGISGKRELQSKYTGEIFNLKFIVETKTMSRLLYFWRTDGAWIKDNIFIFPQGNTSATSSGNDNSWVENGFLNCIRKDIRITDNEIFSTSTNLGSEGFGLGNFDGAYISGNTIKGVGDDPIGIHFSKDVVIKNNDIESIDGRIFVSNSSNVIIEGNFHKRVSSNKNGLFSPGIALIYVGFEQEYYPPPSNIIITQNRLLYQDGAVDNGSAIYVVGAADVEISHNYMNNNSPSTKVRGVLALPYKYTGHKEGALKNKEYSNVRNIRVTKNRNFSDDELEIGITGNCVNFQGENIILNNAGFFNKIYCKKFRINSY